MILFCDLVFGQFEQDLFYGDIDFFEGEMDFTIGAGFTDLPAYVDEKKKSGLRFVTIQDPCIAVVRGTNGAKNAFDRGLEKGDVFIKWPADYVDTNNQSYKTIDPTQPDYLLGHVRSLQCKLDSSNDCYLIIHVTNEVKWKFNETPALER